MVSIKIADKNLLTQNQLQSILDSFSVGTIRSFELVREKLSFSGTAHHVISTHDSYLLFGFSANGNSVTFSQLQSLLKKEFDITKFTLVKTTNQTECTHKLDTHWYLIKHNIETNKDMVESQFKKLSNQDISIEEGYGGVLFAEIADLEPRKYQPHRLKGKYRLFSDEFWEVRKDGKKLADRWSKNAGLLEEVGTCVLKEIFLSANLKKTHFLLSTGYELIIHRKEEIRTWELDDDLEKVSLVLQGTGKLILQDHKPWKETKIKKRKKQKADPIGTLFYKENLPLSFELVTKILHSMQGESVQSLSEHSGISFVLELSEGWSISINSNWTLYTETNPKRLLDSVNDRFKFMDKMAKLLKGGKLKEFYFEKDLKLTKVTFDNGLVLELPKEKRYTLWTIFNRNEGYHIDAMGDGSFTHIVIVPSHLEEKYLYLEKGSTFACLLYALDLYRKWIGL